MTPETTRAGEALLDALKKWRYAPGNYSCKCLDCGKEFEGDKLATTCRPCAEEHEARLIADRAEAKSDLAALPAGDEAEVVKRLRAGIDPARKKLFKQIADDLEAKDATIAQLRGEVERLTEGLLAEGRGHTETRIKSCDMVDDAEAKAFAEKARADKAEKLLADVRYFSRRWSGCKAVADYIDEQAAPDLAGKPESDGWIEWAGGQCPVAPDVEVLIKLRDYDGGDEPCEAGLLRWSWNTGVSAHDTDIIAYRVAEQKETR